MEYQKGIHYSPDLESAVLGACLIEKTAIGRTYGIIEPVTFHNMFNAQVYECLKEMFESGVPIDLLTAVDFLMNKKNIKDFGVDSVPYFLAKTTNDVVSTAHLEYHCYILKRMWIERRIIHITHGGLKLDGDVKEQLGQMYNEMNLLNNFSMKKDWYDMEDLMIDLYLHMDKMAKTSGVGIPSGINGLDNSNGGFHPGQMIILGARPSVGKSAFVGQLALNMARKNYKVGIISLEMSNNEIAGRLAAIDTETDFNLIYRNLISDERQKENFYNRINSHTAKLPIFITDKTNVNINEIRAKASKLVAQKKLDFLIIDYLQLVNPVGSGKNKNRETEVAEISRGVKILAKELNIPAMVLCQLNREVTKRKGNDRYPHLSDLRESGSLEQDADIVMFLHRDWMCDEQYLTNEDGSTTEFEADLIVRKWRNGVSNLHLKLDFDPPKMMFKERKGLRRIAPENVSLPYADDKDEAPF